MVFKDIEVGYGEIIFVIVDYFIVVVVFWEWFKCFFKGFILKKMYEVIKVIEMFVVFIVGWCVGVLDCL